MQNSYKQNPGTLNLAFCRGESFSSLVDFSTTLTGYTVTASINSLVTGDFVYPLTVDVVSAANGQVNVSLTKLQTSGIPAGSYGWAMRWEEGGGARKALAGVVEVSR